MVQLLYGDSECGVGLLDEGEESEWFKVKTGVKQGDVMSGFIFLDVIVWIMKNVTERNNTGIRWKFMKNLEDLDFADHIALLSSNLQHMQTKVTELNNYARNSGPKINSKKTEVLRINSKSNNNMIIAGQQLNEVDKYINLGAIINNQSGGSEDIDSIICKALGSFLTLKQIWNSNKLTLRTKLRLFQALVMSECCSCCMVAKHGT